MRVTLEKPDRQPTPEATIARFVSLLTEIAAELVLPSSAKTYPGTGLSSS
jgi:hypothetical protein